MLKNIMDAWQYIFSHHPDADRIMHQIIDAPETVNSKLFLIWYSEAARSI